MQSKHLFLFLLGLGIFMMTQVLMPVISFKYWEMTTYRQNLSLISPNPQVQVLGVSIKSSQDFPALISTNSNIAPLYKEFKLTISSIGLQNARVLVNSNEFEQNLAHLPGTALPGEKGNLFITGHSSLPQFFRPGNYKAIFAKLPDVKKGDTISVEAGGQNFKYLVQGLLVVDPLEVWVINPPDNQGRYISLMTCVPPGFYLKRLIVLGKLQEN